MRACEAQMEREGREGKGGICSKQVAGRTWSMVVVGRQASLQCLNGGEVNVGGGSTYPR